MESSFKWVMRSKWAYKKPHKIYAACLQIITLMQVMEIDLSIFLDALFWGNEYCVADKRMQWQRTAFLHSAELPFLLDRWDKPPRKSDSIIRLKGARGIINMFAVATTIDLVKAELKGLGLFLQLSAKDDVSASKLTSLTFTELEDMAREKAPTVWQLFQSILDTGKGKKWEHIALTITSIVSYMQSHNRNRLQKLLAIYLKFRGISAKGFDTLHAMGLTMSHKWTCDAIQRISDECMHKKSSKSPGSPPEVQQVYRTSSGSLVGVLWELWGSAKSSLLNSPEFKLATYKDRHSLFLNAPKPIDQLPTSEGHDILQYLLGTTNIAEASYDDNSRLINEWLQQLGWMMDVQKWEFAWALIVYWAGDQLTVDRLQHLFMFRGRDDTSYNHLDFAVIVFGWFHLQMAYAVSLHKQYLGTERGCGLQHVFNILNQKGLEKVLTKGPFHHTLNEALHHVAAAHIHKDWLEVAGVETLSELCSRSAEDLKKLASKIVKRRASSEALDRLDEHGEDEIDKELKQVIMWNRDVLQYLVLNEAVKNSDVGLMENMLPHLLYQFTGSGNSKYAIEVLELMQGLY
ncbi:hypothetical protein DFP72DRAFT_1057077 [Ephemerocybe angulata]|uniref:DUF6589 domain-containing protein n=1 Tax=Ephemerocybe angulata TaxID=980116 RepID=A0A8H6MHP5_9AGAR|nr:hypothetical protein DFP72DRAFT_1057077 [Tulosesus angulatus]